MERQIDPCIVCNKKTEYGIRLYSKLICVDCESEIIRTDVKDDKYPFFVDQLRQIWSKRRLNLL